ncbi:MAG: DnaD domain protein [SAR202 cluster bacterium]|nr:DnaD domain protein [SAR202 cluster bacterium]
MTSPVFPRGTSFTPVPDPLLGNVLQSVEDVRELKCILRTLWHLHRKKGAFRYVTLTELAQDPVLAPLGLEVVGQIMGRAVQQGIFARGVASSDGRATPIFVLNIETDRRALAHAIAKGLSAAEGIVGEDGVVELPLKRPNIFELYQKTINLTISPTLVDILREAEKEYAEEWIREAFFEAERVGARNWRYVETILKRWKAEGKQDGKSGKYTEATDRKRHLKEYVQRRGKLPGT